MEIHISELPTDVHQLSSAEFNLLTINSIAIKHKELRQRSKAPTFALTYGGTAITLVKNCGFDSATATQIETSYHNLYKVSDKWVQGKINQAKIDGYVTGAFGLRVRTPMLHNATRMTTAIQAEARTAGNALGQGWGLLNNRAMREVVSKIDQMGYSQHILPIAAIHDACYYLVRNDINLILWLNQAVTTAAKWNNHPDIYHHKVGLSGELSLFYPSWKNELSLPESITKDELIHLVDSQ